MVITEQIVHTQAENRKKEQNKTQTMTSMQIQTSAGTNLRSFYYILAQVRYENGKF